MDELVAWLRTIWDEDERVARAATWGPWEVGPTFGARDSRVYVKPEGYGIDTIGTCVIAGQVANMPEYRANAEHIARWDPARVLAEVDAKRRMLDAIMELKRPSHSTQNVRGGKPGTYRAYPVGPDPREHLVRLLALPYAGRDGWREEWAPNPGLDGG